MGWVEIILLEASNDVINCGVITSCEKGMCSTMCGEPSSEMMSEWFRGRFDLWSESVNARMC